MFSSLEALGLLHGARVVDLFAGTGAMGIEALSRGAAHATFIEVDRRALAAVEANLDTTGLKGKARVVRADALTWSASESTAFDVALVDPPYDFDQWPALLSALPAAVAVLESDASFEVGPRWRTTRERRYGGTFVTLATAATPPQPPARSE